MVKLTLDKPYTVHARSMDRVGVGLTPSSYKLVLNDPISCDNHHYMKCTLVSAKVPSTFYTVDTRNKQLTLEFNNFTDFSYMQQYAHLGVDSPVTGKTARADYKRTVSVTLQEGNYNIEELMAEVKVKVNAACAEEHATEAFRTFMRGEGVGNALRVEDMADAYPPGTTPVLTTHSHIESAPEFHWEYSKTLNKIRLYRHDAGGRMALGKWSIMTAGPKLGMCLGFNTPTAQQLKQENLPDSIRTSKMVSTHYLEWTEPEYYGFQIVKRTATSTPSVQVGSDTLYTYGHTVNSENCVNMFANDSVYVRISNLSTNAYETLYGGSTNVMAVIPMYAGQSSENFHSPNNPTSCNIGRQLVSELDIQLTDATGVLLDFHGVEHEFQLEFETFEQGTRHNKPSDPQYIQENFMKTFSNLVPAAYGRHNSAYVE